MGIFNPENAESALMMLSMMDFDGKNEIIAKVSEGYTLLNQVKQLQMRVDELTGFISMLRGREINSSAMPQNDRQMAGRKIHPVASDSPHLGKVGLSENPIAIAKKGAEKYALNDYGKMLLDRGNNAGEEVK